MNNLSLSLANSNAANSNAPNIALNCFRNFNGYFNHLQYLERINNTRISRCTKPEIVYTAFLGKLPLSDKSRAKLHETHVTDNEINFLMLRDSPSFSLNLIVCDELRRCFGTLDDCDGFTRRTYETFDYHAVTLETNCILDISPNYSRGGLLGLERNRFNAKPDGIRFYHLHDDNRSFRIKTRSQIQSFEGVQ